MKKLLVYLLGMWEFRSACTTHYNGAWIETYDAGREMAHRLTLRRFEP